MFIPDYLYILVAIYVGLQIFSLLQQLIFRAAAETRREKARKITSKVLVDTIPEINKFLKSILNDDKIEEETSEDTEDDDDEEDLDFLN